MLSAKRKTFFWLFQASYWILYFIFESEFIYGSYPADHILVVSYCFLLAMFGIPLSLLLKMIYELKPLRNQSKYCLLAVVIISSFLVSHLWLLETKFLDYLISFYFYVPTQTDYFRVIIVGTIVLSVWSMMFLLFNSWYELSIQQENVEKAYLLARNAQLSALRYQLNPHFLFNALNSVRALIYKSPPDADEMISKLSDIMRYSLSNKNENEIPLEEEIEVIKSYLNIEKIRFGDKLIIEIKVDPIANEYPIPPFLVIPLVENAVKYGMKTSKMPLKIFISAEVSGNDLIVLVSNTGNWYQEKENNAEEIIGTGTGLKNIKDRLENIYPDNHKFSISKTNENVRVRININKEIVYRDEK